MSTISLRVLLRLALVWLPIAVFPATAGAIPPAAQSGKTGMQLDFPQQGGAVSGRVAIHVKQGAGIAAVQFRIDGRDLGRKLNRPPYRIEWNTLQAKNGWHTLSAVAWDRKGRAVSATKRVKVRNLDIELQAPPGGNAALERSVTLRANASDDVVAVQFKLDGKALGKEVRLPPYRIAWDTRDTTNGWHLLSAVARDKHGRKVSATRRVKVSNVSVALRNPARGQALSGRSVALRADTSGDVAGVQFTLNGKRIGSELTRSPYVLDWDTTTVPNGPYALAAIVRAPRGARVPSEPVNVTVSNLGVAIVSPAAGTNVSGTAATVSASATGALGVQFKLDGNNLGQEDTTAPYSVTWDTLSVADGPHTLTAVARDALSSRATSTVTVSVANSKTYTPVADTEVRADLPTVNFGSAAVMGIDGSPVRTALLRFDVNVPAGHVVRGAQLKVFVTSTSSASILVRKVASNTWTETKTTYANAPTIGPQIAASGAFAAKTDVTMDVTSLIAGSGPVSLAVSRTNSTALGINSREASSNRPQLTVTTAPIADTVPPAVAVSAPAANSVVAGSVALSASASDNAGIAGVRFQLDGIDIGAEDSTAPFSVVWNSTDTGNGAHTLTAIARDTSGNVATSSPVGVTVSNLGVAMSAPSAGAVVSGSAVAVSAAASGSVAGVRFKLDGNDLGAEDTNAPFRLIWDSTSVANGPHELAAVARDTFGNVLTSGSVSVTVSNISVAIAEPRSDAPVSGPSVAFSATVSENVVGVQFKLDGNDLGAEDTSAPFGLPWDTTSVPDGTHTLTAVARDASGNLANAAPVSFTVSNPSIALSAPAAGATVNGQAVMVSAEASANVVAVRFKLDGNDLGVEDTSAPFAVVWDSASAANGGRRLTAVARDAFGNLATASVDVTVSNVRVAVLAPADGATVAGSAVPVAAGVSANVVGVQFKLDGENLGPERLDAPFSIDWDTTGVANGTHVLTAVARDAVGNREAAAASVLVSNVSVAMAAPTAESTVAGPGVILSATASENAIGVQFKVDGEEVGAEDTSAPFSVSWDTTGLPNGRYRLSAHARDAAGNATESEAVGIEVSNIAVAIAEPIPASTVSSSDLTVAATTAGDVEGVQFRLNGNDLGPEDTSAPFETAWDTTGEAEGPHTLSAIARDAAGNIATAEAVEVVVSRGLDVALSAPAAGATLAGSVSISALASENAMAVQFMLDGNDLGPEDTGAPFEMTWDTNAAANGPHTLTAVARDAAGGTATAETVSVTVSNVSVEMTAPEAGATVAGTAAIVTASASDNVVGVQFKLDGENLGVEDVARPFRLTWNTTGVANGTHTLTAVARDAAGGTATAEAVSITVSNISVAMTAPEAGATMSGSAAIVTASASVNVVGVQFELDGENVGAEDTERPFRMTWDTTSAANGTHTLTAIARDAAGGTATAEAVSVTVSNVSVALTAPAPTASVSGPDVTVSASASANVVGVQFKLDGTLLGPEDISAPFRTVWDATSAARGSHTLTALARDAAGQTATASVTVTVLPFVGSLPIGSARYTYPADAVFVSVTGSDSASGTIAAPFATLTKAVAAARTGSTIVMREGTYHEAINVPSNKTFAIQNYPGEAVWLDGSRRVTAWTRSGSTWIHSGWTYEFDSTPGYSKAAAGSFSSSINPDYPMAAHPDQMWIDGSPLRQVGSAAEVRSGTFYADYANDRLVIGDDPAGHEMRAAALGVALSLRSPNSMLRGIGVRRYATAFPDIGMVRLIGSNTLIENVVVSESGNTGLTANTGSGIRITNVTARDNGMLGVHATYADNLRVTRILATGNNRERFNPSPVAGGIKVSRSRVVTVVDSDLSNNAANGAWFDESTYKPTLIGSTLRNNLNHGASFELSSPAIVADNIFADNAGVGLKVNDVDHARVWNNSFTGSQRSLWIAQDYRRGVNASDPGHDPRQPQPDPTMPWTLTDMELANNIIGFTNAGATAVDLRDYSSEYSGSQMMKMIDGNRWINNSRNTLMQWWNGSKVVFIASASAVNALGEGAGNGEVNDSGATILAAKPAALPSDIATLIGQAAGTRAVGNFSSIYEAGAGSPQPQGLMADAALRNPTTSPSAGDRGPVSKPGGATRQERQPTTSSLATMRSDGREGVWLSFTVRAIGSAAGEGSSPAGTVTFVMQGTPFARRSLSDGGATLRLAGLPSGHRITAVYSGSSRFKPSAASTSVAEAKQAGTRIPAAGEGQLGDATTSLAALKRGGFVIAWRSPARDGGNRIRAQRLDKEGVRLGRALDVGRTTPQASAPGLVALPDGFAIAWQEPDGSIVAQRYDEDGKRIGQRFRASTSTPRANAEPVAAAQTDGTLVVAWIGDRGSRTEVAAQVYDPRGRRRGGEIRVDARGGTQSDVAIAALKEGGFALVWTLRQAGGQAGAERSAIIGRRLGAHGRAVGPEFLVAPNGRNEVGEPAVAGLRKGGFAAGWIAREAGGTSLATQRFGAAGGRIGKAIRADLPEGGAFAPPILLPHGENGFAVTRCAVNVDPCRRFEGSIYAGAKAGRPKAFRLSVR